MGSTIPGPLVRFAEGPQFSFLLARAELERDPYLAVRYTLELEWNVQYALMPMLYGQSIFNVIQEAREVVHRTRTQPSLPYQRSGDGL